MRAFLVGAAAGMAAMVAGTYLLEQYRRWRIGLPVCRNLTAEDVEDVLNSIGEVRLR